MRARTNEQQMADKLSFECQPPCWKAPGDIMQGITEYYEEENYERTYDISECPYAHE